MVLPKPGQCREETSLRASARMQPRPSARLYSTIFLIPPMAMKKPTPILFRSPFVGAVDGAYLSQILYQTHQLDGVTFVPMIRTRAQVADPNTGQVLTGPGTGVDYMTNLAEYLTIETGNRATSPNV